MKLLTKELLHALTTLKIPPRRRARQSSRGDRVGVRKGSSLEFSDYRQYLQGDDFRSIDWNAYARSERLFLKLFLEEESRPVSLLVDASDSMDFGNPSKFEYAEALAASLGYVALIRYDRPAVYFIHNDRLDRVRIHSRKSFFAAVAQMEKEKPAGRTMLNQVLQKFALARFPRGIVFVLSDFCSYDGFETIKTLTASGNEVNCLQIFSPEELNPALRGDLALIDAETADKTEISITPHILNRYYARLEGLKQKVRETAYHSMANYHMIDSSTPLPFLILRELKDAGILV